MFIFNTYFLNIIHFCCVCHGYYHNLKYFVPFANQEIQLFSDHATLKLYTHLSLTTRDNILVRECVLN